MEKIAKDYFCFYFLLTIFQLWLALFRGFDNGDIPEVVNGVFIDVFDELDYEKEVTNGQRFEESLKFLGFVTTPKVIPEYTTKKVLVAEWIQGQHLNKLPAEEGLQMTRMAVEACTASLVLTGFVHADPHEGNLMLADDGRLVFLDFGLMSTVKDDIMEAFARGIQACLAEDWYALAVAFKDTGFINDPVRYKPPGSDKTAWRELDLGIDPVTGEDLALKKLSKELGEAMTSVEGGSSRFGALATVLNIELSGRWKMFTPPYIILLLRTFLTLEGIAAQVDPNFNIYEMAMPWALRRSLSQSSEKGMATLRATLLRPDNRVQWDRLLELVGEATKSNDAEKTHDLDEAARAKASSTEAARVSAMNDAMNSVLGSTSGATLRRALFDMDSTDLLIRLVSREAKSLRHSAALALCGSVCSPWKVQLGTAGAPDAVTTALASEDQRGLPVRPTSSAAERLRQRQARYKRKVVQMLVRTHLRRQFLRGVKGALALASAGYLSVRVAAGAVRQMLLRLIRPGFHRSHGVPENTNRTVALA
jgi:predicted unusual protein kinase regulating ubiquinone biosynthesis (AarF/ABC1/UbiB family)